MIVLEHGRETLRLLIYVPQPRVVDANQRRQSVMDVVSSTDATKSNRWVPYVGARSYGRREVAASNSLFDSQRGTTMGCQGGG